MRELCELNYVSGYKSNISGGSDTRFILIAQQK
ncbi:hypothetical protein BH23BAC3_BH23BAC3_19580 [soil metagenome]